MKIPADPTASQSAGVSVTPEPVRFGNAEVSYRPGSDETTLVFGRHLLVTDAQSARDLFYCLDEIFGPYAPADCGAPA